LQTNSTVPANPSFVPRHYGLVVVVVVVADDGSPLFQVVVV